MGHTGTERLILRPVPGEELPECRMTFPGGPAMTQERRFLDALTQVIGLEIGPDGAVILRGPSSPLVTARAAIDGSAP